MLTRYTVKSKNSNNVWEFKYDLNGNLKAFNVLEGILTDSQMLWLFRKGNFPVMESIIKTIWMPNLKKNFEITVGELDLSFDNFWNVYGYKHGRKHSCEKSYNRLSKADKVKVFMNIPVYNTYLKYNAQQNKLYPQSYINGGGYLSDWKI